MHNRAELGQRGGGLSVPRQIRRQPCPRAIDGNRLRIARFEQRQRRAQLGFAARNVTQILQCQPRLRQHLRAEPHNRQHAPLPHGPGLCTGGFQRHPRLDRLAGQAQQRAPDLQCLCVDDRGALGGTQRRGFCRAQPLGNRHTAVDLGGNRRADLDAVVGDPCDLQRNHWLVEPQQSLCIALLVEQMQRLEIAPQPRLDAVGGRQGARLGKQRIGLGKIAQIGFLQRLVDPVFAAAVGFADSLRHALFQRVEKLCCLGIVAAVVAPIPLGQRLIGVERPGLHPRK